MRYGRLQFSRPHRNIHERGNLIQPGTTFDHLDSIRGSIPPITVRAVNSPAQHRKRISKLQCSFTDCCPSVNVFSDQRMKAPSQLEGIRFSSLGNQPFQHAIEIDELPLVLSPFDFKIELPFFRPYPALLFFLKFLISWVSLQSLMQHYFVQRPFITISNEAAVSKR